MNKNRKLVQTIFFHIGKYFEKSVSDISRDDYLLNMIGTNVNMVDFV